MRVGRTQRDVMNGEILDCELYSRFVFCMSFPMAVFAATLGYYPQYWVQRSYVHFFPNVLRLRGSTGSYL